MTRIRAIGDTVIAHPLTPARRESPVIAELGASDLTVGNLEVALTATGFPSDKVSALRSDPANAAEYARLDVDAWSLATNHALDYGIQGLRSTIATLDAHKVRHMGGGENLADATSGIAVTARSGQRLRLLNFCSALPAGSAARDDKPGIAPMRVAQSFEFDGARIDEQPGSPPRINSWVQEVDAQRAETLVRRARADADLVLVSLHWGVAWPFLPPNQSPLAEYQQPLAHRLIDAGASLIIGHHSHSLHPVEFYRDGVILYSLGNFLFHDDPSLRPKEGRLTPALKPILRSGPWFRSAVIDVVFDDARVSVEPRPIVLNTDGEPSWAGAEQAELVLSELLDSSRDLDPTVQLLDGVLTRS